MKKVENKTHRKYVARRILAVAGAAIILGGAYFIGKNSGKKDSNNNINNNEIVYVLPTVTPTAEPVVTPVQQGNYGNTYTVYGIPVVDMENNYLYSGNYYVFANQDVNIKREATTFGTVKATMKQGQVVRYVDRANDNYYRVLYNGEYGYVSTGYSTVMTGEEYIKTMGVNSQTLAPDTQVTPEPVVTPAPTVQPGQPGYQVDGLYYVVAKENVRIRAAANERSEIKGELNKGAGLIYLGKLENNWYIVEFNGNVCYVKAEFATVMSASEYQQSLEQVTPDVPQELYYVVATSNVNIRPQPTKRCDVTAELKKNHGLIFLGQYDKDWYIVEYNGTVSYISTEFSKLMTASDYQALLAEQTQETPYPIVTPVPTDIPYVTPEPEVTQLPENAIILDDSQVMDRPDPEVTPEQYVDSSLYNDGLRTMADLRDMPFIQATTNVRVRAAANTDSEIYYVLRKGFTLPYVDHIDGWYVVEYNGRTAYVSDEYANIIQQTAFPYAPQFYCALKYDANIFDDYGNPVCLLPQNELVAVYAQDDGYYLIGADGHYGYVNSSFCTKLTGTFVVTDISDQTTTLFKDGFPYETYPVITGNVRNGNNTAEGLFEVKGEYHDTVLVGRDGSYEKPVDVFIKYHNSEGFHDAENHNCENGRHGWRDASEFYEGDVYLTNGSRGCTNMLHDDAVELSENIGVGTKVLVKQ